MKPARQRLDLIIVARGLAPSRERARALIMSGGVRVNGQVLDKPGASVAGDSRIETKALDLVYASRGGLKLAGALRHFALDVAGWACLDAGASTGGFTDCLLQNGAARVYAVDVGYGQLAWELRQNPRVVVLERTNARYVMALDEPVDLVVSDVSFISVRLIYGAAVRWLRVGGEVVSLIKPQFEAGRGQVGKGGVVRDPTVHRQVLEGVVATLGELGLGLRGLMVSPLQGPAGNTEFLGWWQLGVPGDAAAPWVERALAEAAARGAQHGSG